LNTSVIDLLAPADGSELVVADGVEPLDPRSMEQWLQGEAVWPPVWLEWYREHRKQPRHWPPELVDRFKAQVDEFLETVSDARQALHRQDLRSEVAAIEWLREITRLALDALEGAADHMPPAQRAEELRAQMEEVGSYMTLLANRLEKSKEPGDRKG
jgi:hypothetical protein